MPSVFFRIEMMSGYSWLRRVVMCCVSLQLSLRVKALKRQVDESEGEVERLESIRRKILRELEEHQEVQEVLQTKVNALENELKCVMHPLNIHLII